MEPFILKKYRQYSISELKVPYKYKTHGTFLWHTIMKSSAGDSSEHYITKRNVPTSCITDFLNALGIMLDKYALQVAPLFLYIVLTVYAEIGISYSHVVAEVVFKFWGLQMFLSAG